MVIIAMSAAHIFRARPDSQLMCGSWPWPWPYDRESATAFFSLVSARYGAAHPDVKGFAEWVSSYGDT